MVQQAASLDRSIDNKQPNLEQEEIDLRQYIVVIIKYWYWIVGVAVVAAAIVFGISSFTPATYQATALVTATQPRYQLQFDSRFQNIPDWNISALLKSQYQTYPALATSDDLLQQISEKTGWSLSKLKGTAQATAGIDPSLLTLAVKGDNPQEVAKVANVWAEIFVTTTNALYGGNGELAHFQQEQDRVAQSLAEVDTALTAFRKENGFGFSSSSSSGSSNSAGSNSFGLIGQRLEANNKLLTDYETTLVRLRQMQREVKLLSADTTKDTSPTIIAGLLSEMINTGVIEEKGQAFQIKLDSVEPVAALTAMDQALTAQISAIEAESEPVRANIATLQADLAAKQQQYEQLIRQRDVMAETYATLSRKVQETQLNVSNAGQVKVASQAAVPTEPISSRRILNMVMAGTIALMFGIFGAFAVEWWRNGEH